MRLRRTQVPGPVEEHRRTQRHRPARRVAAASVATAGLLASAGLTPALAGIGHPEPPAAAPITLAVIGDTPYGEEQRAQFPALIEAINDDPKVRLVLHAGDIKDGSSDCGDAMLADRVELYGEFEDPFVYTPGDNEWTDCHRPAAGPYLPTERLAAVREAFFPVPGLTGGEHPMRVVSQADVSGYEEYVENVRFQRARVVFASVHVVGSDNGLEPWSGLPGGDQPELRLAEVADREEAALAWIDAAFDAAEGIGSTPEAEGAGERSRPGAQPRRAAGVLLLMQAEPVETPGFTAIRQRIAERAAQFGGPVLLVHGDEHVYEVEPEYAGVPNLTRLETYGDTATEWLRLTVNPRRPGVFSWTTQQVASSMTMQAVSGQ